jgi:hypothetical protein
MKVRRCGKQVAHRLLLSQLGVVTCFTVSAQPAVPGEDQPALSRQTETGVGTSVPQPPAVKPAAASEVTPGMMIHIDPQTGAILSAPAPGSVPLQLSPQLRDALSTSHQGLVEVPSSVPGGGAKVDLQGRFQSPLIATVGADGKLKMQHLGEPPESGDKK